MNTLRTYFTSLDDVMKELKPIAKKVAKDNTIIVLVCNRGQSDLMMNFACNCKAKGIDTGNVLVFATDQHTHEVAEGMGFASFYDKRVSMLFSNVVELPSLSNMFIHHR